MEAIILSKRKNNTNDINLNQGGGSDFNTISYGGGQENSYGNGDGAGDYNTISHIGNPGQNVEEINAEKILEYSE